MTMEGMFPNVAVCHQCASATRPGEKFCGVCGALVTAPSVAAVPPSIVPQPDTLVAKPRNRFPLIAVVAGAVAVAVAVALLAVNDTGAHGQLSKTRRTLASTESTLASTHASLDSTQHQLTSTKANLANANSEKTRFHNQLVSTQQELVGVRGNLSDTQNQLNLQAGQLEIVKTCLSGFATALNADLYGDYSSGLAALQSVESACQQASALFD